MTDPEDVFMNFQSGNRVDFRHVIGARRRKSMMKSFGNCVWNLYLRKR